MSIHVDTVNIYISSPEILAELRKSIKGTNVHICTLDQIEKDESDLSARKVEERFDKIIKDTAAEEHREELVELEKVVTKPPLPAQMKECIVCREIFKDDSKANKKKLCSDKCRKRRASDQASKYLLERKKGIRL
jgi:hypothetical protein